MKLNVKTEALFWRLVLIFPITTLVTKYFSMLNQILLAVTFVVLLYLVFGTGIIKTEAFVLLCVMVFNHVYALANTTFPVKNSNTLYYFMFWIMYYILVMARLDGMRKFVFDEERYICNIIRICCLMLFVSMLLPSSYASGYFESFTGNSARTCPVAVFILTLILVAIKIYGKKKYIYFSIFPMYCFFMGDSRTYLGVGLMLFLIVLYYFYGNKRNFYYSLIPMILILALLVASSSVMNRFTNALDYTGNTLSKYYDFWGVVTSGRSVFWVDMLDAFWKTDWMHKLFGNGFHFVYTVRNFWAHNDFIQLLLTFGFLGLVTYLWTICGLFKQILLHIHKKSYPKFIVVLMFLIWLVNCFFNMFYVYMCALLPFPIMLLVVDNDRHTL